MNAPTQRYWKVLDANGRSCHGGSFQWSLPRWHRTKGWVPGAWTPLIQDIAPCARGYHVCRDGDLLQWLNARIYACEVRGPIIEQSDEVVVGQVRLTCPTPWDDVSARLFAVECASDVLSLYKSKYPGDSRVSDCLQTAFLFALGEATDSQWDAAWDAARAAAWDAARAAAWDAAWDAARAAARAAAWDAARAAARAAQTRRLLWWMGAIDEAVA